VALTLPRLAWGAVLAERMSREREIGMPLEHPDIARDVCASGASRPGPSEGCLSGRQPAMRPYQWTHRNSVMAPRHATLKEHTP
jgi:hypothetical protein